MHKIFLAIAFGVIVLERASKNNLFSCVAEDTDKLLLIFSNVLFRSGERGPVSAYPNDPYGGLCYWPDGWGELTKTGREQQYELGQWLRKRYNGLLPDIYYDTDIYIQSTDHARTLTSAASNLAGLYPPTGRQIWNKNLPWQPLPIHTAPEKEDAMLAAKKPCARYELLLQELKNSSGMVKYNQDHAELYKYVTEHSGANVSDPESLRSIYKNLFIDELYNYTLPNWTKKVYPEQMKPVAEFSFTMEANTTEMQRLKVGPLLKKILLNFKEKALGQVKYLPDQKVAMYSAHDSTIANVLNAFGLFDLHCPPFTALVLIELWTDEWANNLVTISYRNSTTWQPHLFTLPGCHALCPLSKFLKLMEPVIPDDWDRECELDTSSDKIFSLPIIVHFSALAISCILFLLLIVFMSSMWWRKHKSSSHYNYHKICLES